MTSKSSVESQSSPWSSPSPRTGPFPWHVAPSGRYLEDAAANPIPIHGDSPWSIILNTTYDGALRYLDDRARRGFNSLVVHLVDPCFGDNAPRNKAGVAPFVGERLDEPVDEYFDHARRVLEACRDRGFLVLLNPMPLGYINPSYPGKNNTPEGWYQEVVLTGVEGVRRYARYLADRLGDLENIMWLLAGDRDPDDVLEHELALADELRRPRPHALMTAHCHPESRPIEQFSGADWLTVNNAYSYKIVHGVVREEWHRQPARPVFLFESRYEGEYDAPDLHIRRQAWWTMTSGGCGQDIGSAPLWMFEPGWEDGALDTPAARAMSVLRAWLDRISWWLLEPAPHEDALLVDGVGEQDGLDTATTAWSQPRDLAVGYVPGPRAVVVNLDTLAAHTRILRTYDVVSGRAAARIDLPQSGSVTIPAPVGAEDWAFTISGTDVLADLE